MFYVGRFLLNAPTYNSVVYNLYFTATNLKVHVFILGVCIWQKHAHTMLLRVLLELLSLVLME